MNAATTRWDQWNAQGGPKYPHEKVVQFTFRNFPPEVRATTRVLDLGCGGGVHTVFLASEGFAVTAIDVSPIAVDTTRTRLNDLGLQAVTLVQGIQFVDFPAQSFDYVICVGVLDSAGLEAAEASLPRVGAVMRPGARGLFMFASPSDFRIVGANPLALHGYSESEVRGLFHNRFAQVHYDRYITTYESGRSQQNDWLITVTR